MVGHLIQVGDDPRFETDQTAVQLECAKVRAFLCKQPINLLPLLARGPFEAEQTRQIIGV